MKVGVLTYHWVANFGANLQTLSTINYIRKRGDEPVVIDWIPEDLERIYRANTPPIQWEAHQSFAREYYPLTRRCRSAFEIAEEIRVNHLDFVIVGSDAVLAYTPFIKRMYLGRNGIKYLKPASDSDFPNPYWGSFMVGVPDVPVAMMSASAQNTPFELILSPSRKKAMTTVLKQFSYLSVRDNWTRKMVNHVSGNSLDPPVTPDPVFAFNVNHPVYFSKEEILQKFQLPVKYVLFTASPSILNNTWMSMMEKYLSDAGVEAVELPKPSGLQGLKLRKKIELPVSPLEWYYLITYSQGYIGELMHPILVSLHNAVPFFSFDKYGIRQMGKVNEEASKIYQILDKTGFLDHRYSLLKRNGFPTPKKVLSAIMNFDREACVKQANALQSEYVSMMEDLYVHCLKHR